MSLRKGFSSRLGFVAAAAGSAVGLGNIWKFPFEVGDGGGAVFLVMYLFFCFVLCFPVLVTEIAIGRKTQLNPVGAFRKLGFARWSIIGKLGIISGVLILSFYNVVAGWAFGYFTEILAGNFGIGGEFGEFIKQIFKIGGYSAVFMIATAYIVAQGVSAGIERASKILMPTLILIILILAAYAFTLPNAIEGIKFYLLPDFSEVTMEVVYSALGQSFFSLSLGMGALITYGSYVGKNEDIITSATLITLSDVGIAFIAGLMMFPFVFSQGLSTSGGAGLIFITLPGVFETLGPTLGIVIGSLFFLLLCFAALTSTVSLLEVPVAYLVDEKEWRRNRAVWIVALGIYIVGLPSLLGNGYSAFFTEFITYFGKDTPTDFMTFISDIANDSFLPLGGCLISIFAAYVWKKEKLYEEIAIGNKNFPQSFFANYISISLRYICPIILGGLFILTVLDRFAGLKLIE